MRLRRKFATLHPRTARFARNAQDAHIPSLFHMQVLWGKIGALNQPHFGHDLVEFDPSIHVMTRRAGVTVKLRQGIERVVYSS